MKLCDRLDNLRDVPSALDSAWALVYAAESVEVLKALTGMNPNNSSEAAQLVDCIDRQVAFISEWATQQSRHGGA